MQKTALCRRFFSVAFSGARFGECYDQREKCRLFTKTLLVMKLTIVLLTIAFVNVYAEGYAQAIVSFTGKSVKLEQVFRSIKKQTGYVVMYNKAVIDNTRPVTISV